MLCQGLNWVTTFAPRLYEPIRLLDIKDVKDIFTNNVWLRNHLHKHRMRYIFFFLNYDDSCYDNDNLITFHCDHSVLDLIINHNMRDLGAVAKGRHIAQERGTALT